MRKLPLNQCGTVSPEVRFRRNERFRIWSFPGHMDKVQTLLQAIPDMEVGELRERWSLLYSRKAEPLMSKQLLRLSIAFRAQELQHKFTARCDAISKMANLTPKMSEEGRRGYTQYLKPGTKLLREYSGKVHEVLVIEDGCFVYRGQVSKSLTEVARKICGKHRSGTIFFGLRQKKRSNGLG